MRLVGFYNSEYQNPEVKDQILLVCDDTKKLKEIMQYIQLELFEINPTVMIEQEDLAYCLMAFYNYKPLTIEECEQYLTNKLNIDAIAIDIFHNWESINKDLSELRKLYGRLYLRNWLDRFI